VREGQTFSVSEENTNISVYIRYLSVRVNNESDNVLTSERSVVCCNETTRCYIPESSHLEKTYLNLALMFLRTVYNHTN
jgi:hypothetical protein